MGLGAAFRSAVSETSPIVDRSPQWGGDIVLREDGGVSWSGSGEYGGAMGVPGAWRAAVLLSDLLGSVPWHAYRDGPGGVAERVVPTPAILAQPSPPDIAMTTYSSLALDLFWHGNGLALRLGLDAAGNASAMLPVSAPEVHVTRVRAGDGVDLPIGEVAYHIGGRWHPASDVIHIKGPCAPGALRGMGILENHPRLLTLAVEQSRQAAAATGAGIPLGTLKSDNPDLDGDEAAELKSGWLMAQRERSIAVLNATTSFEPLAWNPTEAQLLEARKFTLHELALLFGVPLHYLGVEGGSRTYSNVESEGIDLTRFGLGGHLARFEGALTLALAPATWAKANLDALLRSDTLTRYQAHQIAIAARFLSPSEVRATEDRPPMTAAQLAELPPLVPPTPGGGGGDRAARFRGRHSAFDEAAHPRDPDGKFARGWTPGRLADDYRATVTPTAAERAALHQYTGVAYQGMNGYLRGSTLTPPRHPHHPGADYAPEIAALTELAGRYATPADLTVRRFTHRNAVPPEAMAPGTVMTDLGFASSTLGDEAPQQFARYSVEMQIEVPAGSPGIVVNGVGKGSTGIETEGEFIMPPGTSFEISFDEEFPDQGVRLIVMRATAPRED
jgi:HK97 family phage portal protein